MRALSPRSQATKYILQKGPALKYRELLDVGFHKLLKDELKKMWIQDQGINTQSEKEKRLSIANTLKEVWYIMADYNNTIFWARAGLQYLQEEVDRNAVATQNVVEEEMR